jgi:predicted MFS family arabinose efflux permease
VSVSPPQASAPEREEAPGHTSYLGLVRTPGVGRVLPWAAVGRLPIGMAGLALLLFVQRQTGSYADAGLVAGVFGAANSVGAVAQGRLMDRGGPVRIVAVCGAVHGLALLGVIAAGAARTGPGTIAVPAALAGLTFPQITAAMRTLWGSLLPGEPQRRRAYAFESVVVEGLILLGPTLVGLVSGATTAAWGLAVVALLSLLGTQGFAFSLRTRLPAPARSTAPAGLLGAFGSGAVLIAAVLSFFSTGVSIGVLQIAVPAFVGGRSAAASAGFLLTAFSIGSVIGGVAYGAGRWRSSPASRLIGLQAALAVLVALTATAREPAVMAAVLLTAGCLFSPVLITVSVLLDDIAPAGSTNEAYTAVITANVLGAAGGNTLGGVLLGAVHSPVPAFACAAAAPALGACVAAAGARALRRPPTVKGVPQHA